MGFDFSSLFNDPTFVAGASILANPRTPGIVANTLGSMQRINQLKRQADIQQQEANDLATYRKGELDLGNRNATTTEKQYERQNELTQAQIDKMQREYDMRQSVLRAFAPTLGIDPSMFGGSPMSQPAPAAPPAQAAPAPPNPNLIGGNVHMQRMPFDAGGPTPVGPPTGRGNAFGARNFAGPDTMMRRAIFNQESGNSNSIANSIDGAVGPGQVMPGTFSRFAQPGEQITNPNDNRAVASRYMDYLAAKAAGRTNDPNMIRQMVAAGYFSGEGNMGNGDRPYLRDVADGNGKHVSSYVNDIMNRLGPNAPTGYTARVLAGADQPPAQMAGMQAPPVANPGLDMARFGAAMGLAEGNTVPLMELSKQMAPQNVPANSYQRNPVTGETTYVGDPMGERRLAQEDRRIGMEGQRLGIESRRADYEMGAPGGASTGGLPSKTYNELQQKRFESANTEIQKSYDTYKELPTQYAALSRAQADLKAMMDNKNSFTPVGTAGDWKKSVIKTYTNIFGKPPDPDVVNAEDFDSAMAQLWMKAVKQVDQNPTANQQKAIMQSFGTRSNDPAALNQILEATKESFVRQAQRHNSQVSSFEQRVGPDPYSRYIDLPADTQLAASQRPDLPNPKAGMVRNGYVFIGGDPSKKESWAPMPQRGGQ